MAAKAKLDHQELLRRKEYSRKSRRVFEHDWWENLAFVSGEQYVRYDVKANRLVEIDQTPGSERTVHNICMPITRTERAKILKTLPIVEVLPATENDDDVYIARALSASFREWRREWKLDRRVRTASFWVTTCGNVFFKWYWDKEGSKPVVSVVPPFDMYPDPYAKTMLDCRWVIQTQFLDIESAQEKYGTKHDFQESSTDNMTALESRIYSNYADGHDANLPGVIINEYWEPPNKTRPKGKYIVFTAEGIIHESDYPYAHGMIPFTHVGHVERANSKWYASVMDFIRDPQREINRVESQILENRNLANGKWFIPPTLELEADPDASPRQILRASGGPPDAAPQFIEIQALPPWVKDEPDRIKDFARDIAGQHEVSRGQVPGRVDAAQAIQLLQETDEAVMKDTIHSLEEALAEGHRQCAILLKQYGNPMQFLRAYDKDGKIETFQFFTRAPAQGGAPGTTPVMPDPKDIRVVTQTTTGLPQSIAGRWDRVINLWQQKVIDDPRQVLELLDLATESPDLMPEASEKKRAYRENRDLASGHPVVPAPWNNHPVHIDEHKVFMNSDEFKDLDPETQRKFMFHLEMHEDLWVAELQKEAARQAAMQGAAAPPGEAPPPGGDQPQPTPPQANGSPAPVASG